MIAGCGTGRYSPPHPSRAVVVANKRQHGDGKWNTPCNDVIEPAK